MTEAPHVYTAIASVMAEMAKEGISKASKNTQQGYAFRGIDAVYNALAPKLASAGLCILPRVMAREMSERETRNGGVLFYTRLTVEFDIVSAKDGSKHTICTIGEAMDSADKSSNKAMSAAYKYAAFMAFCIPTEGDNDADSTTHEVVSKKASYNPPVSAPAPAPAPEAPHADTSHGSALGASVKSLRECELTVIGSQPAFTRGMANNARALDQEHRRVRDRIHAWITTKIDGAPDLSELDDKALSDLAYATAGL